MTTTTTFEVRQGQLATARWQQADSPALATGQVRVRVDLFALTANNITYAAMGDLLQYWQFFPASEPGWGVIPVWGFGTVAESQVPDLPVGERLYGYWPLGAEAVLTPARITAASFSDGAAQRQGLHAVYNHYVRCHADPFYQPDTEALQALLRPLFTTSWLIDDFLADQQFFGARRLLLSSASSKTAYGTAFYLAQRAGIEVVGLTSRGNLAFCESLGCYHRVLAYEDLARLDPDTPSVYIDFAGSVALREQVHTHVTGLTYSCAVGASHVQDLGGAGQLPGPRPTMFFAPAQIKKRHADWGAQALNDRLVQAWTAFLAVVQNPDHPWIAVHRHAGPADTERLYQSLLEGGVDPRHGHVTRLTDT